MKTSNLRRRRLTILAGLLALLPAAAWAQGPGFGNARTRVSRSCGDATQIAADRALGKAMAEQWLAASTPWAGNRVNEYVSSLGQSLARSSGAQQAISFHVLYSREVDAETLPGGFVFINSAVLAAAESEAELAFVLAHEIAHVNNCDWGQRERKRHAFTRLSSAPLGAVAGLAASLENLIVPSLAGARSSRAMEREADRLAVEYLLRAGYDPGAALKTLQHLEAQGAGQETGSGGLFADHPSLSARRRGLEKILWGLPSSPAKVIDSAEFQEVRNEVIDYEKNHEAPSPRPQDPSVLLRKPFQLQP